MDGVHNVGLHKKNWTLDLACAVATDLQVWVYWT